MSDEDPEEFDPSVDDTDEEAPTADTEKEASTTVDDADGDPFADLDEVEDGDDDPFADIEGVQVEDDPFSDFDVEGDGAEDSENTLFTEMEVSDLDDEEVWAQLADEESTSEPAETEPAADLDSEAGEEAAEATSEERVVEKRAYCEGCEYFSEPPDVSCTYPGSEIVELVDMERFRVRNCPVVKRRENSDITAIAGGRGDEPELEAGDRSAAADSGSDD